MIKVLKHLFVKFAAKGLTSTEIFRVIKDISRVYEENGLSNVSIINNRLQSLGWQDQLIDEHILNLFIFLWENGNKKN